MCQVIPRNILENAKGFAIFTVFKAAFLFSARAGSGVVVAKLEDGSEWHHHCHKASVLNASPAWSAPSAIGTAGLGVGGQAGAEMTDFLVVLNSRSVSVSTCSVCVCRVAHVGTTPQPGSCARVLHVPTL